MTDQYRWPHAVATGLACAAVAYQTAVIWEALSGVSFVTKLGVPLATASAALLPVLAEAAWKQGAKGKALFMTLPVLVLLAYVLPSGISRLGEAQETKISTASKSAADYTAAKAHLDESNKLVSQSEKWAASECASGRGPKCQGQEFTLAQRRAYQRELQAKVDGYKPAAAPWLPAWHPATLTIGLELAIVGALFYGLGPLVSYRKPVPVEPIWKDEDLAPIPAKKNNVLPFVKAFEAANGRAPTLPELQSKFPDEARTTLWRKARVA